MQNLRNPFHMTSSCIAIMSANKQFHSGVQNCQSNFKLICVLGGLSDQTQNKNLDYDAYLFWGYFCQQYLAFLPFSKVQNPIELDLVSALIHVENTARYHDPKRDIP